MTDPNQIPPPVTDPGPVPAQPEATPAIKKSMPIIIGLAAVVLIIGLANVGNLFHGNAKEVPRSALPTRPASPNAQQVTALKLSSVFLRSVTRPIVSVNSSSPHRWPSFSKSNLCLVRNRPTPPL